MLCRNRVREFAKWKAVFDSHAEAHRAAGLHMTRMWRDVEDPTNIFFVFEVQSIEKARAFISAPQAAAAGDASGVMEGEYYFVEDIETR